MIKYLIDEELLESLILNSKVAQSYKTHQVIVDDISKAKAILAAGPLDMTDKAMDDAYAENIKYMENDIQSAWYVCWEYLRYKMEGKQ